MAGSPDLPLRLAIVGLGVAGNARLRAAADVPGVEIAGTVSRRPIPGAIRFEEALERPDIDAFAISTENSNHEPSVRAALDSGKHVLCDYPLAFTAAAARGLLDLSREKDRVLQIEHIALLTRAHGEIRRRYRELGGLIEGSFIFTGGWSPSDADPNRSGPFPLHAESRLLQLWDLFGPARESRLCCRADADGALFECDLAFDRGGRLRFEERRAPGLPRRRSLEARCEKGILTWPEEGAPSGLFAQDLAIFCDRVAGGGPGYCRDEDILSVLEVLAP